MLLSSARTVKCGCVAAENNSNKHNNGTHLNTVPDIMVNVEWHKVSDISTYTPLIFENFQNFAHRSNTNKTPSRYTTFCQCAHTLQLQQGTQEPVATKIEGALYSIWDS